MSWLQRWIHLCKDQTNSTPKTWVQEQPTPVACCLAGGGCDGISTWFDCHCLPQLCYKLESSDGKEPLHERSDSSLLVKTNLPHVVVVQFYWIPSWPFTKHLGRLHTQHQYQVLVTATIWPTKYLLALYRGNLLSSLQAI